MVAARPIEPSSISDALRDIHALDWTPDASYPKQQRSVRYVTTAKIKRQVTPVLDRHGLRVRMTMTGQPIPDGITVLVPYRVCITDGTTEYDPADIWAEGVNDPGKRILTSTTNAFRIYALMEFSIIDGMEDEPPKDGRPFTPIPESSSVPEPPPSTTVLSTPAIPTASPDDVDAPPSGDKLSGLLRKAVQSAYRTIISSTSVSEDVRAEARARYEKVATDRDANDFIAWKREVMI